MADEVEKRIKAHGQRAVPDIDSGFADRLESRLRVEHVGAGSNRPRRVWALLPRLAAAALIVVVGIVGLVALDGDDAGVPVAVVDDEPVAPLDTAAQGDAGDGQLGDGAPTGAEDQNPAVIDPTPEPTPTSLVATPTATPAVDTPSAAEESTPVPTPLPTSTPMPPAVESTPAPVAPSAEPSPTVGVPTSVQVTPIPTTTRVATPVPVPTPSPTATTTPTPQPTPTVEREPVPIELTCEARVAGDAVGIVCSWRAPVTDRVITSYEVMRSRNGADVAVVSRQRASAPLSYADRDINPGDQAIYLVQGLDADGSVVAASVREVVMVPNPS